MLKPKTIIEPVIKWSGSKRYVAPELSKHIIIQKRYFEPFIYKFARQRVDVHNVM